MTMYTVFNFLDAIKFKRHQVLGFTHTYKGVCSLAYTFFAVGSKNLLKIFNFSHICIITTNVWYLDDPEGYFKKYRDPTIEHF